MMEKTTMIRAPVSPAPRVPPGAGETTFVF